MKVKLLSSAAAAMVCLFGVGSVFGTGYMPGNCNMSGCTLIGEHVHSYCDVSGCTIAGEHNHRDRKSVV